MQNFLDRGSSNGGILAAALSGWLVFNQEQRITVVLVNDLPERRVGLNPIEPSTIADRYQEWMQNGPKARSFVSCCNEFVLMFRACLNQLSPSLPLPAV